MGKKEWESRNDGKGGRSEVKSRGREGRDGAKGKMRAEDWEGSRKGDKQQVGGTQEGLAGCQVTDGTE